MRVERRWERCVRAAERRAGAYGVLKSMFQVRMWRVLVVGGGWAGGVSGEELEEGFGEAAAEGGGRLEKTGRHELFMK